MLLQYPELHSSSEVPGCGQLSTSGGGPDLMCDVRFRCLSQENWCCEAKAKVRSTRQGTRQAKGQAPGWKSRIVGCPRCEGDDGPWLLGLNFRRECFVA